MFYFKCWADFAHHNEQNHLRSSIKDIRFRGHKSDFVEITDQFKSVQNASIKVLS